MGHYERITRIYCLRT